MSHNKNKPEDSKTRLIEYFNLELARLQKDLDAWSEDFKKNPADAFNWCDRMMQNAANHAVVKKCLSALQSTTEVVSIFVLEEDVTALVLRKALYPSRSTSAAANQMELYTNSAWSRIIEDIRNFSDKSPKNK